MTGDITLKPLQFIPPSLNFPPPFQKPIIVKLKICNTNNYPIAFKVKTKSPQRYLFRPSFGIITPNSSTELEIVFNHIHDPLPSTLHAHDKFLIQTLQIPSTQKVTNKSDIKNLFVQSEPSKIMSQKLRATFKPFSHILRSKLTSLSDNDINGLEKKLHQITEKNSELCQVEKGLKEELLRVESFNNNAKENKVDLLQQPVVEAKDQVIPFVITVSVALLFTLIGYTL